jgi:hypothetical protein
MSNPDLQLMLTTLLGIFCGVLGWLGRELWSAVQKLRNDLSALEVRISADYVRYDRMQDVMNPINAKLDRIEEALTRKADRVP